MGRIIAQDPHLEIFEQVSLKALDTIVKCAFSQQGNIQTDKSVAKGKYLSPTNMLSHLASSRTFQFYLEAVFNLTKLTHQHMYSLLYHDDLMVKFSSQGHIFSKSSQVVHQYTG